MKIKTDVGVARFFVPNMLLASEDIKQKQNERTLGSSLASEGICLFVDLWEAQPSLGDPE